VDVKLSPEELQQLHQVSQLPLQYLAGCCPSKAPAGSNPIPRVRTARPNNIYPRAATRSARTETATQRTCKPPRLPVPARSLLLPATTFIEFL
jgi:hypothetical protein